MDYRLALPMRRNQSMKFEEIAHAGKGRQFELRLLHTLNRAERNGRIPFCHLAVRSHSPEHLERYVPQRARD